MSSIAEELHEAILYGHLERVKSLLDAGADPDMSPEPPSEWLGNRRSLVTKAERNAKARVTPLHVAVLFCFYRASTKMIRMLLHAGAQTEMTAYNIRVRVHGESRNPGTATPLDLAFFLRKLTEDESELEALGEVINIIQEASVSFKSKNPPTEAVPVSVVGTWKKLLLSEKFSDCHFVCSDGKTLHAHRCILAAASPYFSAYFEGPWGEQQKHKDGQWETANSSNVMTAVLSFVYTGKVDDKSMMKSEVLSILSAALEYDLLGLVELCVAVCMQQLNETNIWPYLQAAHLYDLELLKKACIDSLGQYLNESNVKDILCLAHHQSLDEIKKVCFDFIRANATLVLTDRDMIALASEQPELWDQMTREVSPAKRQRQDDP